jgi:CheY-like chemotaxis protein
VAGVLATVLICEDEPSLRELIRISLDGPYRFAEAEDGEESLEIARRLKPDVVILDVMMPRRSGLEVLAELRRDEELANTRVIGPPPCSPRSRTPGTPRGRPGADREAPTSAHILPARVLPL